MKAGTLALHAARGAWRAKRHRDVQCAIATLALVGLAAVGATGTATGIERAIKTQYQELRQKIGTIHVERTSAEHMAPAMRNARERLMALSADETQGPIEAVSTIYKGPLEGTWGLLPTDAQGQPDWKDRGTISVVADDPMVQPGFGLPAHAQAPFARDDETDTCWRFAFLAYDHALERVQSELKGAKPTIRFSVTKTLQDTGGTQHRANPFEVTPERVIESDEEGPGGYIFLADAALAQAQRPNRKWAPTMFTQMQRGMAGTCGPRGETSDPVFNAAYTRDGDDRILETRPELDDAGRPAPFEAMPIRFDSRAKGYYMLEPRADADWDKLEIKYLSVWLREYDTLIGLEQAEELVKKTIDDGSGRLQISVPERKARESIIATRELTRSAANIAALGGAIVIAAITAALGLSHTHRQRHELALLRSQGASAGTVLAICTIEMTLIASAAAAAGCLSGMAVLEFAAPQALAESLDLNKYIARALVFEISPGAVAAVIGAITGCALVGALGAAVGAARRDPAAQLQLR